MYQVLVFKYLILNTCYLIPDTSYLLLTKNKNPTNIKLAEYESSILYSDDGVDVPEYEQRWPQQ